MSQVSIIMPVKNAENTLGRAIESIQKQTFKNWELIMVDDGSTDRSPKEMQQLVTHDKRIRLEQTTKPGIANALNLGISQSQGKFIARMDADDESLPDRLQLQISFLNENKNFGLIASQVNFMGKRELNQGYAAYVDWTNALLDWDAIRANRFVESPFAHPSVMFRRELITSSDGPYHSGDFPEDYQLWLRWMEQGVQMAKLEMPLLNWYDSPQRLSRNDPRYQPDAFYKIKAKYLARWLIHYSHNARPIWIWGAGRITRKRANLLCDHGIKFSGYIDIDPRKAGRQVQHIPVVFPMQLDLKPNPFVISYVGNRGAREDIKADLLGKGLVEERDFILAA